MFEKKKKKVKNKKSTHLQCYRRLGIHRKKYFKFSNQLIYISLSGQIYTYPSYEEVLQSDKYILDELRITKFGESSAIADIKLLYKKLYKNEYDPSNYSKQNFEHYYIPPSIIKAYNELGIHNLYKEQAECLCKIFLNDDIENKIKNGIYMNNGYNEEYVSNENTHCKSNVEGNTDFSMDLNFFCDMNIVEMKNINYTFVKKEDVQTDEFTDIIKSDITFGKNNKNGDIGNCMDDKIKTYTNENIPKNIPKNIHEIINEYTNECNLNSSHSKYDRFDNVENSSYKKMSEICNFNNNKNNKFYNNFLFKIPTGMGKTLIYDILIIRQVLYKGFRVILTLPTLSLINEKYEYYDKLFGDQTVSLNIKKFNSNDFTGYSYSLSTDLALCTYEQANTILSIIIKNNLKFNYLFILDEIHYINNQKRGFFIESLLTKIKYIQKNFSHIYNIKAYGFSATLSNIDQLAEWLEANVYESKTKLQRIKYLYKMDNSLYKDINKNEVERTLENCNVLDPNHLGYLMSEEFILKKNVLIFCPSKNKSEQTASFISTILPYYLNKREYKIDMELQEKRFKLLKDLKDLTIKVANVEKMIMNGIFYHHSGLNINEKSLIENSFRNNILFCLCCTTTLSVGINMNIHTIIIRSLKLGKSLITKDEITQMAGRCGRSQKKMYDSITNSKNLDGNTNKSSMTPDRRYNDLSGLPPILDYDYDCDGKVIIFVSNAEKHYLEKILYDEEETSKLKTTLNNFQMCKFLLDFIHLKLIKTKKDMFNFLYLYSIKFFKSKNIEDSINNDVDNCNDNQNHSIIDMKNNHINNNNNNNDKCSSNNMSEKILMDVKLTFQYLFENKLITIPYEQEKNYYEHVFNKMFNINFCDINKIFDFQYINQSVNPNILMKYNITQKINVFKKLYHNYKGKNITVDKQTSFFTLPFITILLIFKDIEFNKNLFQNLYVEFIKYLFLININLQQYDLFVYDILNDDDPISCTELFSYVQSASSIMEFIFNYSIVQYIYVKGFPPDVLLMIFAFCINSEINLKIHFDIYEQILMSHNKNIQNIFKFFGLNVEKLKNFELKNVDDLFDASASIIKGKLNIDQIYENLEWIKIKRFYYAMIIYDCYNDDVYQVANKYRLKLKEIKTVYLRCIFNLSYNCRILKNFKNSLDIFCIILENLLSKMKTKSFPFI
ncbi:DEAD box helicase, putative [Plasmodium sp. gorilla clade G3]|nr:DEAD box helicase, putative [Plasmodium sp. gorilla clade G3]